MTSEALHRLDLDESLPGDIEELQLSDENYNSLSSCGVFDTINSALGKMIDEYEDESIQGHLELSTALDIFNEAFRTTRLEIINKIIQLNQMAIKNNTGLFFYF